MTRQLVSSGTKWEAIVGYSRAVRVGNHVHVAGTVASDENGTVVGETLYEQGVYIFQKIEKALQEAGASLSDVTRTRMFVTNIADWEGLGRAHGDFFREIRPASTMVEISKFIGDGFLVEIEVDAIIDTESE